VTLQILIRRKIISYQQYYVFFYAPTFIFEGLTGNNMKLTLTSIGILLLFFSCNSSQNDFEKAKKLNDENKYDAAIDILNRIIDKDPTYDSAYFERGHACYMNYDLDQALIDYTHLIGIPSFRKDALQKRGIIYLDKGERLNAIKDFTRIIEIDSLNEYAYYCRAIAYNLDLMEETIDGRNNYKALADVTKSINLAPSEIDSYLLRGDIYKDLEKYSDALSNYDQAISLDKTYSISFFKRAMLYKMLDNGDDALRDFNIAIKYAPDDVNLYVNRAFLYIEQFNNKEAACRDIMKAKELGFSMSQDYMHNDLKDCN
jgi:tetratricopeptide (TPR) repeat protein